MTPLERPLREAPANDEADLWAPISATPERPHRLLWNDTVLGEPVYVTRKGAIAAAHRMRAANAMYEAGQRLIAHMTDTYKGQNGRRMSIEGDDGEKCFIVHSDQILELEAALSLANREVP